MASPTPVTAAAEQVSGGLPQFDPVPWPGEIVWALVIFFVLYLLISRVFVPRVGNTIAEREDKISGDIGDARRARDAAQADLDAAAAELVAARQRAQKLAQEAQAQAKAAAAATRAAEEARLAEVVAEAEGRIAAARAEAMGHVRAIALDAADAMIQKLTGTPVDRVEIERALTQISGA
jgi:F-type H+-transporting ATPase subunit b